MKFLTATYSFTTPIRNLLLIALLCQCIPAIAQDQNTEALVNEGLENVKAFKENTHYFLAYENNRYRFEADALHFVLEQLQIDDATAQVTIMIQNRGIGIVKLSFSALVFSEFKKGLISGDQFINSINFSLDVDDLSQTFEEHTVTNSSFYKADVAVGVELDYFIGDFTNSIRQKVNVQPSFSTILGKGTELLGIYNMPYFNEIDDDNFNHLKIARLSQDLRLKDNQFLNLSVGYFSDNRFGIHGSYHKFINEERLRLNMDFGLTRRGNFDENFKVQTNYVLLYPVIQGGLTYRWIKYNTDISFNYGVYHKQDLGYKFKYTRQMGLTYIGLFMTKTSFGETVGFHFTAPIGFRKHLKPKRFRIRTREYFNFTYTYDKGTEISNEYFTGDNLLSQMSEYYPSVLKSSLIAIYKK